MPLSPVTITAGQYAQAQAARDDLDAMLVNGTQGGGTIATPYAAVTPPLTTTPPAALDTFELMHLALQRLFSAATLFDGVSGGWPKTSGTFTTRGGTLLFIVSATASAVGPPANVTVQFKVDTTVVATTVVYNPVGVAHIPAGRPFLVEGIAAGDHTFTIQTSGAAASDGHDFVSAVVLELPF